METESPAGSIDTKNLTFNFEIESITQLFKPENRTQNVANDLLVGSVQTETLRKSQLQVAKPKQKTTRHVKTDKRPHSTEVGIVNRSFETENASLSVNIEI